MDVAEQHAPPPRGSFLEVLGIFLRLGLTSFGGPVAHLGYYREELVVRRRWADDRTYADLVALCQFLPGPASTQTAIALGVMRAGLAGGLAAGVGFMLPSALVMVAFAYGVASFGSAEAPWLHGLKVVAVAIVAQAVWGMATKLCPDRLRASFALVAAILLLLSPFAWLQIIVIAAAGLAGWRLLPVTETKPPAPTGLRFPRGVAIASWVLFIALLAGLPLLRALTGSQAIALFDSFFRTGALVFGGGHVILPLIEAEVVPTGWVNQAQFIAGYGAAQALPGPLFTFSAYLGAISSRTPNGWAGAAIALGGIFLPSFLLLFGSLPFWDLLRARPAVQAALSGINAAVVGILLAALYDPVWTSAITGPADVALVLGAFGLLVFWKWPPWLVVLLSAVVGTIMPIMP